MKTLITFIAAVVLFTTSSLAATATIDNQVATNAVIVDDNIVLDSVTLYTTNTTPTLVYIYDGAIEKITGAYTNYTTYITNRVSSYITSLGTTNLHTNSVLFVQSQANAAATNAATPVISIVVPANSEVYTFTPTTPMVFSSNLTISNNLAGVSGIVSYRTQ